MALSSGNIEGRRDVGESLSHAQVSEDAAARKHTSKTGDAPGCCRRRLKGTDSAKIVTEHTLCNLMSLDLPYTVV